MKVSIIIPLYNTENEIGACLDSIFSQTYPEIEIILVNDGSKDRSREIAERYIKENPSQYEIILINHEKNRGASAARNTGIDAATGDYFFFLDSDDRLVPTSIETLVEPLKRKKYDVVIGNYKQLGERAQKWKLNIPGGEWNDSRAIVRKHCHQQIYVFPFNKLCSRDVIMRNHLYFEEGVTHEDALWSLRLCLSIKTMYVVEEITYLYVVRSESVTGSELWRDEVHAYIHIIPLMVEAFNQCPGKIEEKHKNYYFDDILVRRYKLCVLDHLKEEYAQLRSMDPRPASWILKNSLTSKAYLRAHIHRLLPLKTVYRILFKVSDQMFAKTKKNQQFRSTHQQDTK